MSEPKLMQTGLDNFLHEVIKERFDDPQVNQSINLAFWGGAFWVSLVLQKFNDSPEVLARLRAEIDEQIQQTREMVTTLHEAARSTKQ